MNLINNITMKEYCEELPKNFSTWVQFWDEVVKQELHKTHESVKIWLNEDEKRRAEEFERNAVKYSIAYIKERAMEELLQDRFERQELKGFMKELEGIIRFNGYREENGYHLKNLNRIKRILLTQSYRK